METDEVDVEIREMTPSDVDQVLVLWQGMEGIGLDEVVDSPEGVEQYLAQNPGLSSVATVGGDIVGTALGGHDGRRGYLHHLAVVERHRRGGIGRRLVDRSLHALRESGIRRCHVFVFEEGAAAQAFWNAIGWERPEYLSIMSRTIIDVDGNPC